MLAVVAAGGRHVRFALDALDGHESRAAAETQTPTACGRAQRLNTEVNLIRALADR